jgi:CubicO group peptidase (beta-lactamase class C family)
MIKRAQVVAQRDWPGLTFDQLQSTFDDQASKGFGPVILAATGSASNPLFAAVFEPQKPIHLTRLRLASGADATDLNTIQGMNAKAKTDGLILKWIASYGNSGDPRFAAIWEPNPAKTFWSNDGLVDTSDGHQARFDAQTSAWCRPALVTMNGDQGYCSLFVNNEVGPWVARQNLSPEAYQNDFNTWTGKGYFPSCVQGAGADAGSARYSAIFVQSESTVPRAFHTTGPVANAAIDAVVQKGMMNSPVHQAGLAIVHGTKLVYARGYTFAEPDWPLAQPTTHFRMASDSKFVTALGIFQLIEAGKLHLADKLQDILQLKTPSGGAPADANFGKITVEQLLNHTSGLNAGAFRNAVAVQTAFANAGHAVNLPVTAAMTDSYVASLALLAPPGTSHFYDNCGYYMLGSIIAKKWGTAYIAALQKHLFDPLKISRIRLAADLISSQPADESRYQGPDLLLGKSVMTNAQPLVPNEFGTEDLGVLSAAGGLSGAVTDVARLVAIMMDPKDNAAIKRATLQDMLTRGAAFQAFLSTPAGQALLAVGKTVAGDGGARAGFGFDGIGNLGGGNFYAQKGGNLPETSNSVVQMNGDWGFVMFWGGPPFQATGWYPDYPDVMNIAKTVNWGDADLFPQFGMSSL